MYILDTVRSNRQRLVDGVPVSCVVEYVGCVKDVCRKETMVFKGRRHFGCSREVMTTLVVW